MMNPVKQASSFVVCLLDSGILTAQLQLPTGE